MTERFRKERKARWVYECTLCPYRRHAPDLFRAREAQLGHRRDIRHRAALATEAIRPAMDAFASFGDAMKAAADAMSRMFADPRSMQ